MHLRSYPVFVTVFVIPLFFLSGLLLVTRANLDHHYSAVYKGASEVDEGDPFIITCLLNRNDVPQWTINGYEIPPDNDAGYILSDGYSDNIHLELILRVDIAQLHHEGEYRCNRYSRDYHYLKVIQLDDEEEDESKAEVKPHPKKKSNDIVLVVNETITLQCTSVRDKETPVNWYKNQRRIVPNPDSRISITRKYLVIQGAREDDAGEYMCAVEFPFQTGLTDIGRLFEVKTAAKVIELPTKENVKKGGFMNLVCIARGYPSPKISWYKDNLLIAEFEPTDSRISMYSVGKGLKKAFLSIRDMGFEDRGFYTCRAENSLDSGLTKEIDEKSLFVHVRENMIETNEDEPGMGKLLIPGKELILQCNTTECPQCKIVWFKDDVPLVNIKNHLTIHEENNSVIIQRSSYNDSGIYVCAIDREQLKNFALNASISVQSEIKLDKFESPSDVVLLGYSLELHCSAKGAPKPSIKWFKGTEEISSTHERIKLIDHNGLRNGKLLIEEVDYQDRDHYTCEAFNQVNSVNATIFIRIKHNLAALWPFLGILGELIILAVIIIVYERRKSAQEENETDLPAANRNIHDQTERRQDVRQRK